MKLAFIITLTAIGVSFLLPSDVYKAALFLLCAVIVSWIKEPDPVIVTGPNADENDV